MRRSALVVAALVGALVTSRPVHAANFSCATGDVACLINAINTANANGQANTITLAAGAYTLTAVDNTFPVGANGLPSITSPLTITGAGAAATSIERDANAPRFRILHVAAAGTLTLERIAIQGGAAPIFPSRGGGIFNAGTLTLIAATIRNNVADDSGGGIWNENRTVTINQSFIVNNTTAFGGGGISSVGGTLTIDDSVISGNADRVGGGGISIGPGFQGFANTLTITNSRISGNTTGSRGGGISSGGRLIISNSTISGNTSGVVGGGISGLDTWTLSRSTISGNTAARAGGGVENAGGIGLIISSTISNNSSERGGGIESVQGPLTLINATITDNIAGDGGGIRNVGGTPTLQNTILARNTVGPVGQGPDCSGTVTSLGNNLIGDPTGCTITLQGTDLMGDPGLGSFTDTGQPGQGYFPLLPTSRAIDAGNDAACPPTDQLGQPRVGRCDIGAIEFQPTRRCPLGQGFWKNHPRAWPVASLTLGSQTYTQDELLAFFDTPPRGDASVILAHQLIAAKLNVANGADLIPISAIITDADRLLSSFTGKLPYEVPPSSATGQAMVNDATVLESYNNGELTPDCTP